MDCNCKLLNNGFIVKSKRLSKKEIKKRVDIAIKNGLLIKGEPTFFDIFNSIKEFEFFTFDAIKQEISMKPIYGATYIFEFNIKEN